MEEMQYIDLPIKGTDRIICLDVETTGLDVVKDRVIQLAYLIAIRDPRNGKFQITKNRSYYINPDGVMISPEAEAVHKISMDMVKDLPTFKSLAGEFAADLCEGALLGFNITGFDLQILNEEFARCGIVFPKSDQLVFDAGTIFKKMEERTLSAAMQFYCGENIENAHDALADVVATVRVFEKQFERYKEKMPADAKELEILSKFNNNFDLAGKLVYNEKGDIVYNIGKVKGTRVIDDPGFGFWMLEKDFPSDTKNKLKDLLGLTPSEDDLPI